LSSAAIIIIIITIITAVATASELQVTGPEAVNMRSEFPTWASRLVTVSNVWLCL